MDDFFYGLMGSKSHGDKNDSEQIEKNEDLIGVESHEHKSQKKEGQEYEDGQLDKNTDEHFFKRGEIFLEECFDIFVGLLG